MSTTPRPSRWIRWLDSVGCSTRELTDIMHKWEKKEFDHIRDILHQLGHDTDHLIFDKKNQNGQSHLQDTSTSNNQPIMAKSTSTFMHSSLIELIKRLEQQGQNDINQVTSELKHVGFKANEIATAIKEHFNADVNTVVKALHQAEFTLHDIVTTLKDDWNMGVQDVTNTVKTIEADTVKVVKEVEHTFNLAKEDVEHILTSIYEFPSHEAHKFMHELGLIKEGIKTKIDQAKTALHNLGHHLLNPFHWLHHKHGNSPLSGDTVHGFLKELEKRDDMKGKLEKLKEDFWDGVKGLASDLGFHVTNPELAAALPIAAPNTSAQTQQSGTDTNNTTTTIPQPEANTVGVIVNTFQSKALIQPPMQAKLHASILQACSELNLTMEDGQIEDDVVYVKLTLPQGGSTHNLVSKLLQSTSDEMKQSYPALQTELQTNSIWGNNLELFTDLSSSNIEAKLNALHKA